MNKFTSCDDCHNKGVIPLCLKCTHYRQPTEDLFTPKQKKIIDLSVCIESGIDMEFSDDGSFMIIDTLVNTCSVNKVYRTSHSSLFNKCRVRQDHWHSWQGGYKCPLPEGLKVELMYRNRGKGQHSPAYTELDWNHNDSVYDIIAFKVISVADGYKYEWQD